MTDALGDQVRALLAEEATWSRPSAELRRAVLRAVLREVADRQPPPTAEAGES